MAELCFDSDGSLLARDRAEHRQVHSSVPHYLRHVRLERGNAAGVMLTGSHSQTICRINLVMTVHKCFNWVGASVLG